MENTVDELGNWLSWSEAFKNEAIEREDTKPEELCSYGIKPLDDALYRIGKNELVVLGAETGYGKSELALSIAQHNAKQGKTVGVYYLEGGYLEAIRRMKWKDIADKYYKEYYFSKADVDFRKWVYNCKQDEIITDIEGQIYQSYKEKYEDNLYFFPTSDSFTIDKFFMSLLDFNELLSKKLYLDLIVVDHLQYFSLTDEENEIRQITKILRELKRITEYYNTPVLLVSHLRKRGKKAGLPTHEDFYGSGNIAKISTTAIMISPATDRDSLYKNIYPTYLRIVKSRIGIRPNYAFLLNFNLNQRKYEEEYDIYRVNEFGEVRSDPLPTDEMPKWARREQ